MRTRLLLALALAAALAPAAGRAQAADPAKAWEGWTIVSSVPKSFPQVCSIAADGTLSTPGKPVGYLLAPGAFGSFRLHAEWRWPAGANPKSNSGFLVFISSGPVDRKTWPVCVQVQTKANRAGDLLPMAGAKFAEPLSTPPGAPTPQRDRQAPSSEKPFGQWNACEVEFKAGVLTVWVNGVLQNRVSGCAPDSGKIGVQLEGYPYELRNVRIEPLP